MSEQISNEPTMPLAEAVEFLQGKIDQFEWREASNQFAGSDAPQGKAAGPRNPGYIKSPDSYLRKSGSFIFGEPVELKEIENDGHKEVCHQGFSQEVRIHKGNALVMSILALLFLTGCEFERALERREDERIKDLHPLVAVAIIMEVPIWILAFAALRHGFALVRIKRVKNGTRVESDEDEGGAL